LPSSQSSAAKEKCLPASQKISTEGGREKGGAEIHQISRSCVKKKKTRPSAAPIGGARESPFRRKGERIGVSDSPSAGSRKKKRREKALCTFFRKKKGKKARGKENITPSKTNARGESSLWFAMIGSEEGGGSEGEKEANQKKERLAQS